MIHHLQGIFIKYKSKCIWDWQKSDEIFLLVFLIQQNQNVHESIVAVAAETNESHVIEISSFTL